MQTTTFETGSQRAACATAWIAKDATITWAVGDQQVTADWSKPTSGLDIGLPAEGRRDIGLPAEGSGSGRFVALAPSDLIAVGAVVVRRRRLTSRVG